MGACRLRNVLRNLQAFGCCRRINAAELQKHAMIGAMRMIRQFAVAGHELGLFITSVEPTDRFAWRIYCIRREESDKTFADIKRVLAGTDDPERIPVKKNWKNTFGVVSVDDTHEGFYMLDFEEKDFSGYPKWKDEIFASVE